MHPISGGFGTFRCKKYIFVVFYEELLGWGLGIFFVLRDWGNWEAAAVAGGFVEL